MKPRSNTRDIGLTGDSHGAGKGDKSRITDIRTYRDNFNEINFFDPDGADFNRVGVKLIKKYGSTKQH